MGFSVKPHIVRGDLFRHNYNGWSQSVAIDMTRYHDHDDMREAILLAFNSTPAQILGVTHSAKPGGTTYRLVVLEPYHKYSTPVIMSI